MQEVIDVLFTKGWSVENISGEIGTEFVYQALDIGLPQAMSAFPDVAASCGIRIPPLVTERKKGGRRKGKKIIHQ